MTASDVDFLQAFRSCELPSLSHEDHVRLAWIVLQKHTLLSALQNLREGFQTFAASKGKPEVFHETITWAFTVLINERIARGPVAKGWEQFRSLNSDLCYGSDVLGDFYQRDTLESELARKIFLLPDRLQKS